MELPATIRIGDIRYNVLEADRPADDPNDMVLGEIVFSSVRIYINPEQDAQIQRQTLWHEIVHGILHHAGQDHTENHEALVIALGYGLCSLVRNNPDLISFTVSNDD